MKRLIILNGQLIFPDRIDTGKALICKNGKIEQILADKMLEINPDDQIIDAKQQYVSPGFIDMHVHGGGGHDFMDGTVEAFLRIAEVHAKYGTTAMVPTTLTCVFQRTSPHFPGSIPRRLLHFCGTSLPRSRAHPPESGQKTRKNVLPAAPASHW